MFGDNPKRAISNSDSSILEVKKIFPTIQGEGPLVGTPAIFIRLGGCNLACTFCDTEFEDFHEQNIDDIIKSVEAFSDNPSSYKEDPKDKKQLQRINLVVITGGEPLRQPIEKLCEILISKNFHVQIETNGTLYRDLPQEVYIVCSPKIVNKKYTKIREDLLPRINAIKFLISKNILGYSSIPDLGQSKYNIPVFLQPMDQNNPLLNSENASLAIELCLKNNYRFSYQIHKTLGIE